jgi:hypothetical protein
MKLRVSKDAESEVASSVAAIYGLKENSVLAEAMWSRISAGDLE